MFVVVSALKREPTTLEIRKSTIQPINSVSKFTLKTICHTCLVILIFCLGRCGVVQSQEPGEPIAVEESATAKRLREMILMLSDTIGERNLDHREQLDQAADYVNKSFAVSMYSVHEETFEVQGMTCRNIVAECTGTVLPKEIVLVGAHYDSARGTPGANDNGSGVAAMLAIAEKLQAKPLDRTLRFVAFTNEEPPYFQRQGLMGSLEYARGCRLRGDHLVAVISLETMGYFSDEPDSQKLPTGLELLYPKVGNFIGFVSNGRSTNLMRSTLKKFKNHCKVPAKGAPLPEALPGAGWSDHWSFWQEGYQGIMVTDTALFRYPHYHEPTDTIDKLDFVRYSQVVDGLSATVSEMASE
jgi:hypothetical protein